MRSPDRVVVHAVKSSGEFLNKLANLQSRLMSNLEVDTLCGIKGVVGGLFREPITCIECMAVL